jgi:hypothetical protein
VRDRGGPPSASDEDGTNQLLEQLFGEEGALRQLLAEEGSDGDDAGTETADAQPSGDPEPVTLEPSAPPARQATADPPADPPAEQPNSEPPAEQPQAGAEPSVPPSPPPRAPTLVALKRGDKTCMPVRADGQPCVPRAQLSDAPKDACRGDAPGTLVTFTNRCSHAVQLHRYVASEGARSRRTVLTLGGSGDRKSYTECPDGRTERVLVAVPTGELESANCR